MQSLPCDSTVGEVRDRSGLGPHQVPHQAPMMDETNARCSRSGRNHKNYHTGWSEATISGRRDSSGQIQITSDQKEMNSRGFSFFPGEARMPAYSSPSPSERSCSTGRPAWRVASTWSLNEADHSRSSSGSVNTWRTTGDG